MSETVILYYAPFLVSFIISSAVAWALYRRRSDSWISTMALLMLMISLWIAGYTLELSTPDLERMKFFIAVEYIAITNVPVLWHIFGLRFSSSDRPINKWYIAGLFVIPVITLGLVWTSNYHGLMRTVIGIRQLGPMYIFEKTFGPWFWIFIAYSYVLMASGSITIIRSSIFQKGLVTWQRVSIIVGAGLPWLANFITFFNIPPFAGLDLTPIFFSMTGLALYWVSFPLHMIDLLPIARGAVMDNLRDLVIVENIHRQVVDINPMGLKFLNLKREQVIGFQLADILPMDVNLVRRFANVFDGCEEVETSLGWYEVSFSPLCNRRGRRVGRLLSLRDINARKQEEQGLLYEKDALEKTVFQRTKQLQDSQAKLQNHQAQLEAIFNNAAAGIILLNLQGEFIQFNDTWASMLGYQRGELAQLNSKDISYNNETNFDRAWFMLKTGERAIPYRCEERFMCQDGRPFWGDLSVTPVIDQNGVLEALLCVVIDISDRKRYEQQIIHNSMHDTLTGLPNRDLFTDRLGQALQRSNLYGENRYSILYLDYDHFKDINDSLGHNFGDHLLIQSSARLKKLFLPTDTYARMGGDEFLILLDIEKDPERVQNIAEHILASLKEPFLLDGRQVVISSSIGILTNLVGYQKVEEVMRDADIAMYRAKLNGRNCYEVFDAEMRARALARLDLEIGLRSAIEQEQLYLDFQPIISIVDQRLVGFEALARWLSPQHGLVFPSEFIPLAEDTGQIYAIGEWVLKYACRSMAAWQKKFPACASLGISVNLSPRQFSSPDLTEQVARILHETGLPPENLRIEITEGMLLDDLETTELTLKRFREMGVQTMIDDFGTGYSSLSYLHRFPISTLKIDRAFVSRLDGHDQSQSSIEIVRAVLAMAREMGIRVVAEGIETDSQMEILRELSCDYGQGYLISRPIPESSVDVYLRGLSSSPAERPTIPVPRKESLYNYLSQ